MKRFLLFIAISICSNIHTQAQIIYHDINPDTTVSTWDAFAIKPAISSLTDFEVWWHPWMEAVVVTNGDLELLHNSTNMLPSKLDSGDIISSSGVWQDAVYEKLDSGSIGNWQTDATDKYLAFRFKNSTTWLYGWLKMTVASGASSFTVKEWAYNGSGGQIRAGQTSATGINTIKTDHLLTLYPNPVYNTIQLKILINEDVQVFISDINMRVVNSMMISKGQSDPVIDVSALPKGIYNIKAEMNNEMYIGIFLKQ